MSGEHFGPFELIEPLGHGGMAEVWRAVYRGESGFAKQVALKRILPSRLDQPNLVTWFHDEARLCSRLRHLNIVEVYDFGSIEGTPYLTMEFVQGWTLSHVLQKCRARGAGLPVAAVIELGIQTCTGLAYAHGAVDTDGTPLGVIHRDLKPANLMISVDGLVKIMDFGIAKAASNEYSTETDSVRGTPSYLSPEVCDGRRADHRADLFTLGAILVEALLGTPLFLEENTYRTMYRIAQADVGREVGEIRTRSPALADVLQRTLRADPEERHEDADALRYALQAIPGPGRAPEVLLGPIRKVLAPHDPAETGPANDVVVDDDNATRSWEEAESGDVEVQWRSSRSSALRWLVPALVVGAVALAAVWVVPRVLDRTPGPAGEDGAGATATGVDSGIDGGADLVATPEQPTGAPGGDGSTKPDPGPAGGATGPTPPGADAESHPGETEAATAAGEAPPGFTLLIPDEAAVGRAIQDDPALRGCFEQAGDRGETPPTSVGLAFRMAPAGSLEVIRWTDPVPAALEQCLTTRLRQMEFGASSFQWDGKATLAYRPVPPGPVAVP